MEKWFGKFTAFINAKIYTRKRVSERYLLEDEKFLKKAYKHGHDFIKRNAVIYLGEFKTQDNFKFLLSELMTTSNIDLKPFILLAILSVVSNKKITVTKTESFYLDTHLSLLDKFKGLEQPERKPKPSPPITFRDKIGDHLDLLEKMKKDFNY